MELLLGFVLPPFIGFVNSKFAQGRVVSFIVSILASVILALILKFPTLHVTTPESFLQAAYQIFAESQITYHLIYKNSSVEKAVQRTPEPSVPPVVTPPTP